MESYLDAVFDNIATKQVPGVDEDSINHGPCLSAEQILDCLDAEITALTKSLEGVMRNMETVDSSIQDGLSASASFVTEMSCLGQAESGFQCQAELTSFEEIRPENNEDSAEETTNDSGNCEQSTTPDDVSVTPDRDVSKENHFDGNVTPMLEDFGLSEAYLDDKYRMSSFKNQHIKEKCEPVSSCNPVSDSDAEGKVHLDCLVSTKDKEDAKSVSPVKGTGQCPVMPGFTLPPTPETPLLQGNYTSTDFTPSAISCQKLHITEESPESVGSSIGSLTRSPRVFSVTTLDKEQYDSVIPKLLRREFPLRKLNQMFLKLHQHLQDKTFCDGESAMREIDVEDLKEIMESVGLSATTNTARLVLQNCAKHKFIY